MGDRTLLFFFFLIRWGIKPFFDVITNLEPKRHTVIRTGDFYSHATDQQTRKQVWRIIQTKQTTKYHLKSRNGQKSRSTLNNGRDQMMKIGKQNKNNDEQISKSTQNRIHLGLGKNLPQTILSNQTIMIQYERIPTESVMCPGQDQRSYLVQLAD